MPSSDGPALESTSELLDQVVADYVRAVESGDPLDQEQLLAAHPELADDLRDFFRHRDRMERLLDPLRSADGRVLNVRCPHCHNAIELVEHAQVTELSCPTCGSSFSLIAADGVGRFPGGTQRIGQFQLVEQVGVGQFGSVWKARDLALERTVAIKIPRSGQLREAEAEMFLRDARLSAQLHHPNIVGVHEVGKLHDTLYIVSDFIQGASLKEWNAVKRLTPNEAARLTMTIATALHHAHEAGVVHRDLKPGNVMMDLTGEPHLVDFGLAKRDSGEITITLEGQILGTPGYMSPEQASGAGHHVDRRADVYSLGVILYELLTGELPFRGERQMLVVQIIKDDPPPPRRLDHKIPRDLETICLKCLRKEPGKRYSNAAALAEDLQRFLDRKPIEARRVGRVERSVKWARRRPAIAGLLAALFFVLAVAGVVGFEGQRRMRVRGLVGQLFSAEIAETPRIIDELAAYSRRASHHLRLAHAAAEREGNTHDRLHAALALHVLGGDGQHVDYLTERLLAANQAEFPVIRDVLSGRRDELAAPLWTIALDASADSDRRFRACCALAAYAPDDNRWEAIAPFAADRLVSVLPSHLAIWQDQLRPARQHLTGPLTEIFRDVNEWGQKRNLAADSLADYLAGDPESLYSLLMESEEQQFGVFIPALAAHRTRFVELLQEELQRPFDESASEDIKEQTALRLAYAAIAVFRLDLPALAVPVLRQNPDPRARTRFIHWAPRLGVDPRHVVAQLNEDDDPWIRQALVLTLGEFTTRQLTDLERRGLLPQFLAIYRDDLDAGVHGAVKWLLQRWGFQEQLSHVESELASKEQEWQESQPMNDRQWYVNTEEHTMIVVHATTFFMGATDSTVARVNGNRTKLVDRPRHLIRIDRNYAIAATEVTRKQWGRFVRDQAWADPAHGPNDQSAADECPQNQVTWYEAVAYCNWLSRQEGLSEDQWCYQPNEEGVYSAGMRMAPNFLLRTGYRLPTEAEWEFACRAGARTSYYYGESEPFLQEYAVYEDNSRGRTWEVARFKPNSLGLFDMHGNVWEWCQNLGDYYSEESADTILVDAPGDDVVTDLEKILRGGGYEVPFSRLDAADRGWHKPYRRSTAWGFRVVRTIEPSRAIPRE